MTADQLEALIQSDIWQGFCDELDELSANEERSYMNCVTLDDFKKVQERLRMISFIQNYPEFLKSKREAT